MCKGQRILYLLLGGVVQVTNTGKYFPSARASQSFKEPQTAPNRMGHMATLLRPWEVQRKTEMRQISPLPKVVSVSQISIKRQLQFLWHLTLPNSLAGDRRTTIDYGSS